MNDPPRRLSDPSSTRIPAPLPTPIPEWMLAAYVDGELAAADLRQVEAVLMHSEESRRLVLALREEARLLTDVLQERALPDAVSASGAPPARGLAFGVPLALLVVGVVLAALGTLVQAQFPAGAEWLRPSRLLGVNAMLFDVLFALRDRAPEWLQFGVSVAALASLAGLATFLAGALLRRFPGAASLVLGLLLLCAAMPAKARVALHLQEGLQVPAGETVDATVVANGDEVVVDGIVQGDLLVFAERVTIRGKVLGNLVGAGRELDVSGEVRGQLLFVGADIRVEGRVGDVLAAFDRFTLAPKGRIPRDLTLAGHEAFLEGAVARDVTAFADRLELRGSVGRDVEAWSEHVSVRRAASVAGTLHLHAHSKQGLALLAPDVVAGGVAFHPIEMPHTGGWHRYAEPFFYLWLLVGIAGAFLVGMLFYALAPGLYDLAVASGRDFATTLGVGFIATVCVPLAILLVALTVVGIPLAAIAAVSYLLSCYLAGILVAGLIGRGLAKRPAGGMRSFGTALLLGLLLVMVGKNLPFIGPPFRVVVLLLGMGLLVERCRAAWLARETVLRR